MKYLIFSDSHRNTEPMDKVIRKEPCDTVIHLGDVADDAEHLRRFFFHKTVCAVCGNNDFFKTDPTEIILEDCGHRLFLCHGHRQSVKSTLDRLIRTAKENKCDIALFGHTHSVCDKTVDGIHLINPGSIGARGTYAVLNITEKDVSLEIKTVESAED